MNFSGKIALSSLFLASALVLGGCSTTTQTDLNIDDLYFPKMQAGVVYEVISGDWKGQLELLGNCIVLNDSYNKYILIWDDQTEVNKVGSSIVISHPNYRTLKVGQRAKLTLDSGMSGPYNPNELELEPISVSQRCEPTGYATVGKW